MPSALSLLIGGAAGFLKLLFSQWHERQLLLMQKAGMIEDAHKRAATIKDTHISFTRRTLALIFAAALTAPVFYGLLHPDAVISVPQVYIDRGFWDIILPWRTGTEVTKYVEVKALVIAAPIYDICAVIVGFYFGSGGSRSR